MVSMQSAEKYLPEYLHREEVSAETRQEVLHLITVAIEKNPYAAVRASRGKRPLVQDAFHDALVALLAERLPPVVS